MTNLLRTLYTYAQENRMAYSPEDKLQLRKSSLMAEQAKEKVLELLSEDDRAQFECYMEEEDTVQLLELGAIFRAGLAIGLELSRL